EGLGQVGHRGGDVAWNVRQVDGVDEGLGEAHELEVAPGVEGGDGRGVQVLAVVVADAYADAEAGPARERTGDVDGVGRCGGVLVLRHGGFRDGLAVAVAPVDGDLAEAGDRELEGGAHDLR